MNGNSERVRASRLLADMNERPDRTLLNDRMKLRDVLETMCPIKHRFYW
jgi:hypothetical protein